MIKLPQTNFKLTVPHSKEKTLEILRAYTIDKKPKFRKADKYIHDFYQVHNQRRSLLCILDAKIIEE